MTPISEKPNTFLWVLRGLTSAYLIGYLVDIFAAIFIAEFYPTGQTAEDLLGVVFLVLFVLGYFLMWRGKEILTGIIFIVWYSALWPAEIFVGGPTFEDSPIPGILMLILGILFFVHRAGVSKRLE